MKLPFIRKKQCAPEKLEEYRELAETVERLAEAVKEGKRHYPFPVRIHK